MRIILLFLCFFGFITGESSPKQVVAEIFAIADVKINGDRPSDIQVYDERLYARLLKDGSMGLGESYMEGWWDVQELDQFMYKIMNARLEEKVKPTWLMIWNKFKAKAFNMQDKRLSSQVVYDHYEIGDNLYELMLGDTMAYTCAYWKNAHSLDEAQRNKFDLIARKMGLMPGMRVLDLGCGWGGFAMHIAKYYGVNVVAVNLSEMQCDYAKKISEGLPVEVRTQDYRDVTGTFDRIISIGLFEHVGSKNYRNFMEVIHRCLTDDGLALVHTIGSNISVVTTDSWINKYIFPHGHLPSIAQFGKSIEKLFVMEDWHNMGINYDATLMAWFQNFDNNWSQIEADYPDPFYRMWKYYLLSCAGAFRARKIQLWQVVLSKHGVPGGYESVR